MSKIFVKCLVLKLVHGYKNCQPFNCTEIKYVLLGIGLHSGHSCACLFCFLQYVICVTPDCSSLICVEKCLLEFAYSDSSAAVSTVHFPEADDHWNVMISYTCRLPYEILIGSPNRTCHCGQWNDTEPTCKSKNRNSSCIGYILSLCNFEKYNLHTVA